MYYTLLVSLLVNLLSLVTSQSTCPAIQHGSISGDIILGFSFPLHESAHHGRGCSDVINSAHMQLLEAANYAIKKNLSVIPGVQIGLESWDSCKSYAVNIENAVTFLNDRQIGYGSGEGRSCGTEIKPGIIGHLSGYHADSIASLMSDAEVSVTSYGSVSAKVKTSDYPYLTSLLPSDELMAQAIADLLANQGWKYVAVLYQDNIVQKDISDAFLNAAIGRKICVARTAKLESTTDIGSVVEALDGVSGLGVVVTFLSGTRKNSFFDFLIESQTGLGYVYVTDRNPLFSGDWVKRQGSSGLKVICVTPSALQATASDTFDNYYKGLNLSSYDQTANTWFTEFWEKSYNCSVDGSGREACGDKDVEEHKNSYERSRLVGVVIDAISAHIEALRTMHQSKCGGAPGLCVDFLEATPDEYQSILRSIEINGASQSNVSFGEDGGPRSSSFDILIIHFPNAIVTEAGSWVDGTLSLFDFIHSNAMSECGAPCTDPSCNIVIQKNETKAYIPGDIILAGLFSIHEWDEATRSCGNLTEEGALRLQAMIYAVNQINSDATILPQITLGLDGLDTCRNAPHAADLTLNLLSEGDFDQSGSGTRPSGSNSLEHIFGIIGPETEDETKSVVKVANTYSMPLMGYAADSFTLGSTYSYPGFARTIPSNTDYFIPVARTMAALNFKYIQVLYSSGSNVGSAISLLRSYAKTYDVCVAQSLQIPSPQASSEEWDALFDDVTTKPYATALFLYASAEDIKLVLSHLFGRDLSGKYFIVAGNTWDIQASYPEGTYAVNGAVVVIRPPRRHANFKQYVSTLTPDSNTDNPWFGEYWANKFQCTLPGVQSPYSAPCSTQTGNSLKLRDAASEIFADIIDGVYAMANALHALHLDTCGGIGGVCSDMLTAPGSQLFNLIKQISFMSPNDGRPISFNFQGDVVTDYEVYNYQNFTAVKVGTYSRYSLTLNTPVKFYDASGQEKRSGLYSVCNITECIECQSVQKEKVAEVAGGDVWIAGFFDINEPKDSLLECSTNLIPYNIQLLEAFLFAVDQINADNNILPNLKLGALAFDTCGEGKTIVKQVSGLLTGSVEYRSGYQTDLLSIDGFIGGSTLGTEKLKSTLSATDYTVVSYGGAGTIFSEDQYILRTVPSNERQVEAILSVLNLFGWKYVAVLYSDAQDIDSTELMRIFSRKTQRTGHCIAFSRKIEADTNFDSVMSSIQSIPEHSVVLLLTSISDTQRVLLAAEEREVTNVQWVGTDFWGSREYVTLGAEITSLGAIIIELVNSKVQEFRHYYTGLSLYSNSRNPWWRQFWGEKFSCNVYGATSGYESICSSYRDSLSSDYVQASEITHIVNAVKSFAIGLQQAMDNLCPNVTNHVCAEVKMNKEALNEYIRAVEFVGPDGRDFKFNDYGDGPAAFDILNIQKVSSRRNIYTKVGSWRDGELQMRISDAKFYEGNDEVNHKHSQCTGRCLECNAATTPDEIIKSIIPGQIQISAVLPIHAAGGSPSECGEIQQEGIVNLEALLYALDLINQNENVLPLVTVGASVFDSCSSSVRAYRSLSDFVTRADEGYAEMGWYFLAGIVAGEDPTVLTAASMISSQYEIIQLSYSSSLGIPSKYFTQTAPPSDDYLQILFDVLDYYKWNLVDILVDQTDGDQVALSEAFVAATNSNGVCVQRMISYTRDNLVAVQNIFHQSQVGPIGVVFMSFATANYMFSNLPLTTHMTVIIPMTYPLSGDVTINEHLYGSILISPPQVTTEFSTHLLQLSAEDNTRNPWFEEYLASEYNCGGTNQPQCSTSLRLPPTDAQSSIGALPVMDAVFAIANGLENMRRTLCGRNTRVACKKFWEAPADMIVGNISKVSFTGVGDRPVDLSGSVPTSYTLWNTGLWDRTYKNVGSWRSGQLTISDSNMKLLTTDLNPGIVESYYQECANPPGPVTPARPSDDSTRSIDGNAPSRAKGTLENNLTEPWFIILIVLCFIGICLSIVAMVAVVRQRDEPQVQIYSLVLQILLLVGIILAFFQNLFYGFQVSNAVCFLRLLAPFTTFTMCALAVFLMTLRLYRILAREKRISGPRTMYINNRSQAIMYFCLLPLVVIQMVQLLYYADNGVASIPDDGGIYHCAFEPSILQVSFLLVYMFMFLMLVIAVAGLRRSRTIFARELICHVICGIVFALISFIWLLVDLMISFDVQSGYLQITCFIYCLQAYALLLTTFPVRIFSVLQNHEPFNESASVVPEEYMDRTYSVQESAYDMTIPAKTGVDSEGHTSYENPSYFNNPNDEMQNKGQEPNGHHHPGHSPTVDLSSSKNDTSMDPSSVTLDPSIDDPMDIALLDE